jgi:hypothetical protein
VMPQADHLRLALWPLLVLKAGRDRHRTCRMDHGGSGQGTRLTGAQSRQHRGAASPTPLPVGARVQVQRMAKPVVSLGGTLVGAPMVPAYLPRGFSPPGPPVPQCLGLGAAGGLHRLSSTTPHSPRLGPYPPPCPLALLPARLPSCPPARPCPRAIYLARAR